MEDIKYYVLWRGASPLLEKYLNKYYEKLLNELTWLIEKNIVKYLLDDIVSKDNCRDFILSPDISSLINVISYWRDELLESKLNNEIFLFLDSWILNNNLALNKGDLIKWTNIRLTTHDNNPYNRIEDHPDRAWKEEFFWFWIKSTKEWLDVFSKTFSLLKETDLWFYSELNSIIKKIIPIWTSEWVHNSASYKECIGHLYLWYTIDSWRPEINNLEAIIHESSHNKLNLLMHFDPIIENDMQEKYYSAIRPDARHMKGVFLWYHAFAPTMYIIMKWYNKWLFWKDEWLLDKIVLYYFKVKLLQRVIKKYSKLTKLWMDVSWEIDYVITLMDRLFKELNPNLEIIKNAKRQQSIHFKEVNDKYSYLEY